MSDVTYRENPARLTDPSASPFMARAAEPLTPEEQAECDALYEELKPLATASARDYVLARTPARLQEAMLAKIEADWPAPPVEDATRAAERRRDASSYTRRADPVADPPVGSTAYPRQ